MIGQSLLGLRDDALALEFACATLIEHCSESNRASARNLIHYLSLRQKDLRPLQEQMIRAGLSSLGTLEACTLGHLDAVLRLIGQEPDRAQAAMAPVDYDQSAAMQAQRTHSLLGQRPAHRAAHIMVTMPTEAATDESLVKALVEAGMDVMRINCAHDSPEAWLAMVRNLQSARHRLGVDCRIQADLCGPKLRTGPIGRTGQLRKLKPPRNPFGQITSPMKLVLVSSRAQVELLKVEQEWLLVEASFLLQCSEGDRIELVDVRGRHRNWPVLKVQPGGAVLVSLERTVYLVEDTWLTLVRKGSAVARTRPLDLPDLGLPLVLCPDDRLILTRAAEPGRHQIYDLELDRTEPARIHCTLSEAFACVQPGHRVWFDDGRIGGLVESCNQDEIDVRITVAAAKGSPLRAEKGINFPDTCLDLAALTAKDLRDLEVVCGFADIVALSFVRRASDLEMLHQTLNRCRRPDLGVVLKIENRDAFENLPSLLLTGLRLGRPFGVMIARGDLAVEVGFERLSEVQQEIVWLCEAAHVPVIWATQILETMAKTGQPTRAEVSDAGMSVLAECAMLNKGPYIVDAVRMLGGILARMDQHYHKRRARLRRLAVAEFDLSGVQPPLTSRT
jgi:pyruvate kinase